MLILARSKLIFGIWYFIPSQFLREKLILKIWLFTICISGFQTQLNVTCTNAFIWFHLCFLGLKQNTTFSIRVFYRVFCFLLYFISCSVFVLVLLFLYQLSNLLINISLHVVSSVVIGKKQTIHMYYLFLILWTIVIAFQHFDSLACNVLRKGLDMVERDIIHMTFTFREKVKNEKIAHFLC